MAETYWSDEYASGNNAAKIGISIDVTEQTNTKISVTYKLYFKTKYSCRDSDNNFKLYLNGDQYLKVNKSCAINHPSDSEWSSQNVTLIATIYDFWTRQESDLNTWPQASFSNIRIKNNHSSISGSVQGFLGVPKKPLPDKHATTISYLNAHLSIGNWFSIVLSKDPNYNFKTNLWYWVQKEDGTYDDSQYYPLNLGFTESTYRWSLTDSVAKNLLSLLGENRNSAKIKIECTTYDGDTKIGDSFFYEGSIIYRDLNSAEVTTSIIGCDTNISVALQAEGYNASTYSAYITNSKGATQEKFIIRDNPTFDTSINYVFPKTCYDYLLPTDSSLSGELEITTYVGDDTSLVLGTKRVPFSLKINPSDCQPQLSIPFGAIKDIRQETVQITGNDQVLINNESFVKIEGVSVQPQYGATIVSQKCSNGKLVKAGTLNAEFPNISSGIFSFEAIDSRGIKVEKIAELTFVPYSPPTCTLNYLNDLQVSEGMGILSGEISGTCFGNYTFVGEGESGINYPTIEYQITKKGVPISSEWKVLPSDNHYGWSSYLIYRYPFIIEDKNLADISISYGVQLRIVDKLYKNISNIEYTRAAPIFDWTATNFNFNVPVTYHQTPFINAICDIYTVEEPYHRDENAEVNRSYEAVIKRYTTRNEKGIKSGWLEEFIIIHASRVNAADTWGTLTETEELVQGLNYPLFYDEKTKTYTGFSEPPKDVVSIANASSGLILETWQSNTKDAPAQYFGCRPTAVGGDNIISYVDLVIHSVGPWSD